MFAVVMLCKRNPRSEILSLVPLDRIFEEKDKEDEEIDGNRLPEE